MRNEDEATIDSVRAAADMDHPWIPGAQAQLIRDAADLLERQREELQRHRTPPSMLLARNIDSILKKWSKKWKARKARKAGSIADAGAEAQTETTSSFSSSSSQSSPSGSSLF